MQLAGVLPYVLATADLILLHEGHDHNNGAESTGLDPITAIGGLVGIVLVGGVVWYTYSNILE